MALVPFDSPLHHDHVQILLAASAMLLLVVGVLALALSEVKKPSLDALGPLANFCRFFYASFLKPHTRDSTGSGQQAALESFYEAQAGVYDSTRKRLLRGREDMLGLVAAQLKHKVEKEGGFRTKPIWVDIGGGTGYNIEAMQTYLDVPTFFSRVYLVDLSPSLCEVARKRFERLGWEVKIICQDARTFRLEEHDDASLGPPSINSPWTDHDSGGPRAEKGVDLITMSYSLSMIPDYYSVVDSISSLLDSGGLIGVVDFYVQSIVETSGRNYTGGVFNRHVNWLGRVFWRAWFDVDRVGLEGARRDYLEYRFGTLKTADERNYLLGGIPYYIFLGTQRRLVSPTTSSADYAQDFIERLDASCTESPYLSPRQHRADMVRAVEKATPVELRSKAYESAVINLSSNLPLPSTFYQNDQRRIYYNDQLSKHTQFHNEYIYAFTWEDPRVDHRLLRIGNDDVVLCITSAGDNVLDYLLHGNPRRIHAVDLNPNQNHLLELKVAAFQSLSYAEVWKLFGEGKYPAFRDVLISKLSPRMSSQACQYWLNHANVFTAHNGHGLYETGGSRHAIKLVRWLFRLLGLSAEVQRLCKAKTLNEQREIWPKIRRVLMSRALHWTVIGTEWFAWRAAGVPPAQRRMIQEDFVEQEGLAHSGVQRSDVRGQAMWEYMVNTLDPVVHDTLISEDNYFYLLCLQGKYSRRCHPGYLTAKAHTKLSRSEAFEGLRIHTDDLNEVIARIAPGTLTIAVIMDSMDWFGPAGDEAATQVQALNYALRFGGRVLLRSAGLKPWYMALFEQYGFSTRRVGARLPGTSIDRVNMYASTWICTKSGDLAEPKSVNPMDLLERVRPGSTVFSTVEQLEI
ncbi:hypothetical protein MMC08_001423 [Hypocenomyce scalaris]|nr:hypothetical protein [Hypocenomyce scalaris]